MMVWSLTKYPGMWSQVGLRKHHHKQSYWRVLFQVSYLNLKDDAVKVLHSISQQIWITQQWLQDWKRSVFIPMPKRGNAKECSHYHTIVLISHTSKAMLKIFQVRLQQYVNCEHLDVQDGAESLSQVQLWGPMDCGPPVSSVLGVSRARTMEWLAISSSKGSSCLRDQICATCISWIGRCTLPPIISLFQG